ncbi:MAG: hypothetical protein FWF50_05460 [Defluviitaleaceae bacterium]|nr:hypothetical protein [Defluviitaleaceae bacterium]
MTNKQLKELVNQNRISKEDARKLKKPSVFRRGFNYIAELIKFVITLEPPEDK